MTDELFTLPETPSPRLAWMREHGVYTLKPVGEPGDECELTGKDLSLWTAWKGGEYCDPQEDPHAYGATENEALYNLALKLGVKTWWQR